MNTKMKKFSNGRKEGIPDILDFVFLWSIKDVLNKNLYVNKVKPIPDTFSSTEHFMNSFKLPLIEETRAEFCSGLESVGHAPACEISSIWFSKKYKPPKELYYGISTKIIHDVNNHAAHYEPETGDIFAITNLRPKSIDDLIKPDKPLHFGYVSMYDEDELKFEILLSQKIDWEILSKKDGRLFVTFLMNVTTNMRIWRALNPDPHSRRLGPIHMMLQHNSSVDDGYCTLCISEENFNDTETKVCDLISSFGLDKSQIEAVLSSISMTKCTHQQYNSKLIWGPPGTGKTKTLASILFVLLKLNYCRTLTCAPTNVAVIQVAKRLLTLFLESSAYDTYGLGDIVLVGNEKRMKIDDDFELVDIFLKYRVKLIQECLLPLTGWKISLESMISLLEDPKAKHDTYVGIQAEKEDNMKEDCGPESSNNNEVKRVKKRRNCKKENKMKGKTNGQASNVKTEIKTEEFSTFDEFLRKSFVSLANRLVFCAENLYTHLPTSCLPLCVAKQMIELVGMLNILLENARKNSCNFTEQVMMNREGLMGILKLLHKRFPKPKIEGSVKDFCLNNAQLIFCTASGAIKIGSDVEIVIIDEAAQLKECESTIPLQIFGLKTVILIGDDRQLPAMVRSKVLGKMNFGRSLFQRLAGLGKEKHLLNIQYRMHPSISLFPNKEFYQNKIVNAPIVEGRNYVKNYLKGSMFGSYSFIHVSDGKENFLKGHSPRNFEEAEVIDHIIAKLFKEHYCITKQKVSVGVISPYKGQVGLLQEKLEKKYTKHKENFCINIRSIDGFQGGEEDIIIISTVRSNGNGSVGFLSNRQRTNVALTRARYCLWIVGSGSTLGNSASVWKNLIRDAKNRGCFYYADEIVNLNHETPADKLDFFRHLKLEEARWKVTFSNEFKQSISNIKSVKAQKRVRNLLRKIADGWRQSNLDKPVTITDDGATHELLVIYKVDKTLNLAWTVDILEEESSYIQVIKVWDVLPDSKVHHLAKNLSVLFEGYSVNFMNLCKYKSYEGNLVVPKSWKLHSSCEATLTNDLVDDCLSYKFAAMNVKDNQGKPSSSVRKNHAAWKPVRR